MEKYLLLDLTNGDGYTDPTIGLYSDRVEANAEFYRTIGENVMHALEVTDHGFEDNKVFCYFEDGENNYGTFLINVKPGQIYEINCDFAGEITLCDAKTIKEMISNTEHDEGDFTIDEKEDMNIGSVTCNETSTHYIYIQIK